MPRILIVDDNNDILVILSNRFRAHGFDVSTARDGEEALREARNGHPDVIVMDVMMPELNGFQVCRELKSDPELGQVPIALFTCKDSEADRFWADEVRADLYLTKPMDPARVVDEVKGLLT